MVTVYTICAVVGGVVLVLQFLLTVFGIDAEQGEIAAVGDDVHLGDDYVDVHQGSTIFFGILSFKSLVALIAFFGIGGRAALEGGASPYIAFLVAVGAGAAAMIIVAWLMRLLHTLKADGTVRIERCVGLPATVYLGIPGNKSGVGKVTVSVQERTMEYPAITAKDEIPTGARVVVVGVSGSDTLEVELDAK